MISFFGDDRSDAAAALIRCELREEEEEEEGLGSLNPTMQLSVRTATDQFVSNRCLLLVCIIGFYSLFSFHPLRPCWPVYSRPLVLVDL